jgi:hypothetical protein
MADGMVTLSKGSNFDFFSTNKAIFHDTKKNEKSVQWRVAASLVIS